MKSAAICLLLMALLAAKLEAEPPAPRPQAMSLLGKPLFAAPPSDELLAKLETRRRNYAENSNADNLIWLGRFQAYAGDYQQAIETYTRGIEQFPEDPRFLRHRGHRYITTRQFEKAIADFERAVSLIEGRPNEIEPDGMPNEKNIPVSTLHGNIYYHKGLAHYLLGDLAQALQAFRNCLRSTQNDDNIVSATHWIYSILRRLNRDEEAEAALHVIHEDMDIIENHSYYSACLFYKGLLTLDQLTESLEATPSGDSIRYAVANWLWCNGDVDEASLAFRELVGSDGWQSFGHIAAEADLARLKGE